MKVYRMISLWFSAECKERRQKINDIIQETIQKVPSYLFVPLSSQLFSRLGQDDGLSNLSQLLSKLCLDHPYHCIIHLLYVCNGRNVGAGVSHRNASTFLQNSSTTKVREAESLVNAIKKVDDFTRSLVESYQALANAYIHLALAPVDKFPRGEGILYSKVCKSAPQRLDQCLGSASRMRGDKDLPCILTKPPPIRPGCDYNQDDHLGPIGSELVVGFEKQFSVTKGGNSMPKIVICRGSRGGKYKQLVKGNDEIRQDAIMEQVFGYVNELMSRRGESSAEDEGQNDSGKVGRVAAKSMLKVATYNIVPLSPASGVSA